MPISTTCPNCKALFRLAEELAGKTVRCQRCENIFVVPDAEAELVAPGVQVQGEEEYEAAATPGQQAASVPSPPPFHPEDIPVTAQLAEQEEPHRKEDRHDRDRPRRRPRRDQEVAKRGSRGLVIALTLLGVSLLLCIGLSVLSFFWIAARGHEQQQRAFRQRNAFAKRGGAPIQFKANAGGFAPNGMRKPNRNPAIELKLGDNGLVRDLNELTLLDPPNPDNHRHKHYAIELQAGKKYQFDLQSTAFDAYLILVDGDTIVAENDDIEPQPPNLPQRILDSRIIYTPTKTGLFKIEATFFDNGRNEELGPFALTVREVK